MKYFNMAADDKGADPEIGGQLRRLEVVGIDSEKNKARKYLWSHICKIVVSWCVGPVLDAPGQWRGWNMCHICFARRRPYAGKFFEIHHREKVGRLLILFKLQMILVQKKATKPVIVAAQKSCLRSCVWFLFIFVFLKVSLRYSRLPILILYNHYWRFKWKKFLKIDVSLFPLCEALM